MSILLLGRALAEFTTIAAITLGAGVHGGNKLKSCRKLSLPSCSGYDDLAGFQGFSEDIQHPTIKTVRRDGPEKFHPDGDWSHRQPGQHRRLYGEGF